MQNIQAQINDLTSFMNTEVYVSLDEAVKAALVRKKVELCGIYFLEIASKLNRNKQNGCYAPHKAVMIMAVMDLVKSGNITSNVILLDKELKGKFKEIWHRVVPIGSPYKCEYHNPFTHLDSAPFWNLSCEKNKAIITSEALFAFSHEESRTAIRHFLIHSIRKDTISEEYAESHHGINWMVAEDMIAFAPVLGMLIAI